MTASLQSLLLFVLHLCKAHREPLQHSENLFCCTFASRKNTNGECGVECGVLQNKNNLLLAFLASIEVKRREKHQKEWEVRTRARKTRPDLQCRKLAATPSRNAKKRFRMLRTPSFCNKHGLCFPLEISFCRQEIPFDSALPNSLQWASTYLFLLIIPFFSPYDQHPSCSNAQASPWLPYVAGERPLVQQHLFSKTSAWPLPKLEIACPRSSSGISSRETSVLDLSVGLAIILLFPFVGCPPLALPPFRYPC